MGVQGQEFMDKRSQLLAERIIGRLAKRQMNGYYAADAAEAVDIAMSLIPEGSSVGWGGSMSTVGLGLNDLIRQGNYQAIDRDTAKTREERDDLMRQCFAADAFIMGTNALTEDGQLVNLDGDGNRVAALIWGPKKVIVLCGMNKVVPTLEDAITRTRKVAAPINAQRFEGDTPCRNKGVCGDCLEEDCICGQLVVTRFSLRPDRIHVILVNENLGF